MPACPSDYESPSGGFRGPFLLDSRIRGNDGVFTIFLCELRVLCENPFSLRQRWMGTRIHHRGTEDTEGKASPPPGDWGGRSLRPCVSFFLWVKEIPLGPPLLKGDAGVPEKVPSGGFSGRSFLLYSDFWILLLISALPRSPRNCPRSSSPGGIQPPPRDG